MKKQTFNGRTMIVALVAPLAAASGSSVFGQVVTEDAGFKSAPDTPVFQEWFRYSDYEDFSEARLDHKLYFRFGEKTEIRFTVPTILHRRVSFANAYGGTSLEDLIGLGEATITVKRSLWQTDDVMISNRWSLMGEIIAPTGNDDRRDDGVEIPRNLQLSSGSWGLGGGTAYTVIRDRHRFSTELMSRHRLRHDGFRPGESIDWNLAYWYRLSPIAFDPEKQQPEVRAVIELLNKYSFESKSGDHHDGDHGLETWIAPGLQWFPRPDVLIDFGLQFPVIETINDELGERRWQAVIAVRFLL